MINIDIIKTESQEHSNNLSDWTNEALLKELLWSTNQCVKLNKDVTPRFKAACEETEKRLRENADEANYPVPLSPMIMEQCKLAKNLLKSHKERNNFLRQIEEVLGVKSLISDTVLP